MRTPKETQRQQRRAIETMIVMLKERGGILRNLDS